MFDLIIRGGRIMDGSGSPWYYGDVGICGDRIAAIGKLDGRDAQRVIDASNRVVCPGFIDMHCHSDIMLLASPRHEPKVMQGVTTDVIGMDGLSYAPLSPANLQMMRWYLSGLNGNPDIVWDWSSVSEYLDRFDRRVAVNVAYLVPHNALRLETMGFVNRAATAEELKKMRKLMAQAMQEGAVGFSTGLDYCPARYSNTEELIEICQAVAEYDGISAWHVRYRDLGVIEGTKEAIRVGEKSGAKVHLSHYHGLAGERMAEDMLALVDKAREKGIEVTFDAYPYTAGSSILVSFLPPWAHEGGPAAIMARLKEPETKEKIYAEMRIDKRAWDKIFLALAPSEKNKKYIGKNLAEGAKMAGKDVPEFICQLLLEENLDAGHTSLRDDEEDMRIIIQHLCHIACSDALLIGDKPHPRGWGTFPRFLGVYSRELGLLSLEEMIRHMTSAPAARLGLTDRGLVKKGLAADLVIFDPKSIKDTATFKEPKQYPVGIDYVLVNGALVVEKGGHTGVLNGRALSRM